MDRLRISEPPLAAQRAGNPIRGSGFLILPALTEPQKNAEESEVLSTSTLSTPGGIGATVVQRAGRIMAR